MKVIIVGGGPSGLFLSILLKSRGLTDDIAVYEQNPKDATYGFGIGLQDSAINKLTAAEPKTMQLLGENMCFLDNQVVENHGETFTLRHEPYGAIERLNLLQILEDRCDEMGIPIHYEYRLDDLSQFSDADLIVGADGANSIVRKAHQDEFGTEISKITKRFAWYGLKKNKREGGLRFRMHEGGHYSLHYYSYTPELWTVVTEVGDETWHASGMDKMTDAERKAHFEHIFDDIFQGEKLIENKSTWGQFTPTTNKRWFVGNCVLMGDALYRGHYSIGSGTRLAMEDAQRLADVLANNPGDVSAALNEYQETGVPAKAKLMEANRRSYTWYESIEEKSDWSILPFIEDFMNRTGRMPMERLEKAFPNFAEALKASKQN